MRFFPSTVAAIIAGAVVMPLFELGRRFIEETLNSQMLLVLWIVIAFFVPLFVSTCDFKYASRRRRELGSFFRPLMSADDFRLFYIPAWKRMAVWFISRAISILLLKVLGIEL